MLRTAKLLPPTGLSTLGSDPTRFQTRPPACYRASWQLLGRDSHPLATTSLCWSQLLNSSLQLWAHERSGLVDTGAYHVGTRWASRGFGGAAGRGLVSAEKCDHSAAGAFRSVP
jgi:hypothetical protein